SIGAFASSSAPTNDSVPSLTGMQKEKGELEKNERFVTLLFCYDLSI
ncbi:hypothetical protein L195_g049283, partial [Trifolium pratense]